MSLFEIITLAVALGTDAFSVAIVCGIQQFGSKSIIRISSVIAVFHIIMPLTGFYGGQFIQNLLIRVFNINSGLDHLLNMIGAGLLMLVGGYMLIEQWLNTEKELCNFNISGWGLIVLAFSVSIDSFSVGVSLGMMGNITFFSIMIIGMTAGIMMASGLHFGSRLGQYLGDKVQFVGGLGLIFLGFHFVGII
ncbi:MAG: manganese efflux pump MntP family protein [Halothermotrichaceae bacterium]